MQVLSRLHDGLLPPINPFLDLTGHATAEGPGHVPPPLLPPPAPPLPPPVGFAPLPGLRLSPRFLTTLFALLTHRGDPDLAARARSMSEMPLAYRTAAAFVATAAPARRRAPAAAGLTADSGASKGGGGLGAGAGAGLDGLSQLQHQPLSLLTSLATPPPLLPEHLAPAPRGASAAGAEPATGAMTADVLAAAYDGYKAHWGMQVVARPWARAATAFARYWALARAAAAAALAQRLLAPPGDGEDNGNKNDSDDHDARAIGMFDERAADAARARREARVDANEDPHGHTLDVPVAGQGAGLGDKTDNGTGLLLTSAYDSLLRFAEAAARAANEDACAAAAVAVQRALRHSGGAAQACADAWAARRAAEGRRSRRLARAAAQQQ